MNDTQLWWASPFNVKPEIIQEEDFPSKLTFYDTTLRDGEQTIGCVFDPQEKLKIAKALDGLGIERIEAGMPVVSTEDRRAIELILEAGLKAEIWGFCRAVKSDIDACIELGIENIICEIATSSYKMKANNFTKEDVLKKVNESVYYAKARGIYTAFFAVDATRADLEFLELVYRKAVEECGADEVVMVDTLGVATPETMYFLTKKLNEWVNVPISVHCHNDFGLAVACTLAALKAGAFCAQGTINGLGEKTGNADIAEIAIAARLYGIELGIDLKKLYPTAKLVERISRIPLSPLKPVSGENVFKRESGVTAAQLISYPPAVEGYSPEILGRKREVLLSKKSGKKSVEYKLRQLDVSCRDEQLVEILNKVKSLGMKKKGLVSDDEFEKIVHETLGE